MTSGGPGLAAPGPAGVLPTAHRRGPSMRRVTRALVGAGLVLGLLLVGRASVLRGRALQRTDPEIFLGAAPLVGRNFRDGWDWRFSPTQLLAGALVLAVAASWWRGWWWRAGMRSVVAASALGAGAFAVLLALTDGRDGLLHGAADKSEYYANLRFTPDAASFVSQFLRRIGRYSVHVRGHPPGFTLLLKAVAAVGLRGVWPVVGLSLLGTLALPVGVLLTVRAVAGDGAVRRSAPFLVVAPYAIWMATSADAVYTAVGALGIAGIATAGRTGGRRGVGLGLAGGLLLGFDLYGTYLTAVLFVVPVACLAASAVAHRAAVVRAVIAAGVGGLVIVCGFTLAGFWWFDGVEQTRREYWAGSAQFRTWSYFGAANLVAAAISLGPASLFGAWRLRDRRLWWLVGAGLTAMLVSHVSQYTRGEVERIWLLFYPWMAVAGAGLSVPLIPVRPAAAGGSPPGDATPDRVQPDGRRRVTALWIVIQGCSAIVLQAALVTKW